MSLQNNAASWLSPKQQKLVFQNSMNLLSTSPLNRVQYQQVREQYLEYLLDQNDAAEARKVLDSFSGTERQFEIVRIAEIRLAAAENKLTDLLAGYTQNAATAPPDSVLQESAAIFTGRGLANASQQVLELLYTRQIESSANPAAYLGLAEIRVKQGRLDQARDLLNTLNQQAAVLFEQLSASARVFSVTGHPREAQDFLKLRIQAAPWDYEARLELAKTEAALNQRDPAANDLQKIVISHEAAYGIRTQAAQEQGKNRLASAGSTGSREMDLLSNRAQLTADSADSAFFFAARTVAAEQSPDANVKVRLLLGAIAERPDDNDVRRMLLSAAVASRQYRLAVAANRDFSEQDPKILSDLADAHQQLGEFADAVRLYKRSAALEKDNSRRQALEDKAKQAQTANERRLENDRRRPVMRADLDQPNVVRRRLP
jgi:hypothetical protein